LGHSPDDDLASIRDADPERVAAALAATQAKMHSAPNEPYWPFHRGELYAALDSTTQAISNLQAALTVDPEYAPAAALLSKLYYDTERYEEAVPLLEDFLSRNNDAPDALRAALALHLEAVGNVDRAQAVLNDCSASSKEARAARTFVSLRGDDMQSALDAAKLALEDDPRSAVNHNNYGIALLFAGRPVEARDAFSDALELNDRLPGALYNMAIVEAFYFFNEEAGRRWFERYKKYADKDPDDLETLFRTDVTTLSNSKAAE
jgi:tetratricopeptide (TPR) repeat protein